MATAVSCAPDARPATIRFSTADHAPAERFAAWHEIYRKTLIGLDIEPLDEAFHADVTIRQLPGLGIMTGSRSAALYRRTQTDTNDIIVSFGLSGDFEAAQCGRTASMAAGDAVVVTSAERGHVAFPSNGRSLTLCMPERAVAGLGAALCRRIPADNTALKLLRGYLGALDHDDIVIAPELQTHAVTHVHDLVALALGANRDAAQAAEDRGARAARLHAIKADIGKNLAGSDLSVATVAARHRLPVRYVQRLFESEGMTFTDFVLERRLAHARRLLIDPRLARVKIGALAAESGFRDLSYFNRAFRRRYGATPSDMRPSAKR